MPALLTFPLVPLFPPAHAVSTVAALTAMIPFMHTVLLPFGGQAGAKAGVVYSIDELLGRYCKRSLKSAGSGSQRSPDLA